MEATVGGERFLLRRVLHNCNLQSIRGIRRRVQEKAESQSTDIQLPIEKVTTLRFYIQPELFM